MTLRRRILLAMIFTLLCLISGLIFMSRSLLTSDYVQLERKNTEQNALRAKQAFEHTVAALHEKTPDWAAWDDTYQFMRDKNARYITSNLTPAALQTLSVEMVLYVDEQGKLFYAATINRLPSVHTLSPQSVLQSLHFSDVSKRWKPDQELSTAIAGSDVPLMLSVRPIKTSENTGKPRGWIVMARHFDSSLMARLRRQTQLSVSGLHIRTAQKMPEYRQVLTDLTVASAISIHEVDENFIAGYTSINDLHGKPIFLLKTVQKREIYHQGLESVNVFLKALVAACIIFSAVFLLILEFAVLTRLSHLNHQVGQISANQMQGIDLSGAQVTLKGDDELTALSSQINGLLGALEITLHRVRDAEEEVRAHNESLEQIVAERVNEQIAERTAFDLEIRERNAVLENVVEGIARLDARGCFVSANAAYTAMLDYSSEELIGRHWSDTIYPPDTHKMEEALHLLPQTEKMEVHLQGLQRDGWTIHQQTVIVAVRSTEGELTGCYLFTKDVSERTGLEAQIAHQAYHDALTGLPNRTLFMERLQTAQQCAKHKAGLLAVIFVDLDNFKIVNDSLGHEAGDALLMTIAERLLESVRPGDTVARLGGDEFILLLEDVPDVSEIVTIVERILIAFRSPILLTQKELFASASIGIAYTNGKDEIAEDTLLRHADTAMYHAKSQGKSGYAIFDPSMNALVVERMEIETGLRLALERDEFLVYYQPLIDLETGHIIGAEALIRWHHPERGLVSPVHFIPIAEETGLIVPIGYFVLKQACEQWKTWAKTLGGDFEFTMNVNLSGRQLQRSDVVERVIEIIEATQMPPQFLKLEITESVIMENLEDIIAKLHQFRDLGIKLAIDDFGTGYSSMSSLSVFPVNTVKIDKAFVQQLGAQDDANAVVAALIMLAKTLRMDVTAEGVENKDQVIQLQTLGCNIGQGFYFSRPATTRDFTDLLEVGLPFRFERETLHRNHIEELLETYLPSDKAA